MPRPRVTGALIVDLSDLGPWATDNEIRMRLWAVEGAPQGATVRLRVTNQHVWPSTLYGLNLGHVDIVVEGESADVIARWVGALREAEPLAGQLRDGS